MTQRAPAECGLKQIASPNEVELERAAPASVSYWSILIAPRTAQLDSHGREVLADVRQIGLDHVEAVRFCRVYLLGGMLTEQDIRLVANELLADPVAENYVVFAGLSARPDGELRVLEHGLAGGIRPLKPGSAGACAIEVHPLPGVMNPAALSTLDAAQRLLSVRSSKARIAEVQTARRYNVVGARSTDDLEQIAASVLANDCIERWYIRGFGRNDAIPDGFPLPNERPFALRHVPMREMADDQLARLSREGHLFLSLEEMRTIQDYFRRIGREPTDLELETLAQTWSEHCVHKTLKSAIDYHGADFGRPGETSVRFDNLLKDTIAAATHALDRDWCLSVFVDNAGIVTFDDEYGIAFKVETHNHPSAIEPYGGASTGVGGCIRDIMGCGLGAKPIASTDVFCLAPPDFDPAHVPAGVLHPRRVLKGVVRGVRDYGNRMGIPTVNGAIYFDERYLANPLVFCGCVGLIPRKFIHKEPKTGDYVVVAGGRTGRDGIHGATFSSAELTEQHADEFSHAVQIGNAIEEKKLLDAQLLARDHESGCLYSAVTDCGAGGLSSAVGEMGAELGVEVELEKAPLKYVGLRYDEIWISEAQERMVFAVPPDRLEKFLSVFAAEEVEATVIGRFTNDRKLHVRYNGQTVGELDMAFLHDGLPRTVRRASWGLRERHVGGKASDEATKQRSNEDPSRDSSEPRTSVRAESPDPNRDRKGAEQSPIAHRRPAITKSPITRFSTAEFRTRLLNALRHPNIASKEWVIRQYDHEVQGRSVIKPLVGPGFGPSDAAVLRPRYDGCRGIALGCGLCPQWSEIDPYWMAILAIDEALRNIICVGADPDQTAILDNFCWPKCDNEESLGALVRTCVGAKDAAIAYGLPFISGKDSLNNEFTMSPEESRRTGLPQRLAIPPTLLISALGMVPDVRRCVSMDLKQPGNVIVLASAPVNYVGLTEAKRHHDRVSELIRGGAVRSAHDVSDGGLAVAVAEMCIASGLGLDIDAMDQSRDRKGAEPTLPLNKGGLGGVDSAEDHDWNRLDLGTLSSRWFDEIPTTYVLEMTESDARQSGFPVIGRVSASDEAPARVRFVGFAKDSSRPQQIEAVEIAVDELARAWREPLFEGGNT